MKYVTTNKFSCLIILCGLLLLSACATSTGPEATSVEERATERWGALLSDDLAGAYEFLSPGYRSSVTSVQYQRSILLQRVQWTDAKVRGSECSDDTCEVSVLLSYKVLGGLPGVREFDGDKHIKESWIKADGVWYLVP